ncbi:MAG: hypothetical protein DI551_03365 [Micavibrio aeruginosavorus]|uniref:Uncharacterized protein n=1 Tax=Micavibrio aeruginosavorus TaxID=349221 RepID=A0A2W5N9J0_9BACT|nr:MAG: hypothetical protein DI551_03365 [Micavibrio aeruginosavorus]
MTILKAAWRYWKSLCIWFGTAFVVLVIIAAIVNHFKITSDKGVISQCIESGGAWDDGEGLCKSAA